MSESSQGAGPTHRSVEIGVALFTATFAVVVVAGSLQVGVGWGEEGPKAGFFPFYVGLVILGGSIVNLVQAVLTVPRSQPFAEWGQLGKVVAIAAPTALYVALIPFTGIYVASILLIGAFMKWLGHYAWPLVLAIAIGMPLVTFLIFELWFLVALPKGPIEALLGF